MSAQKPRNPKPQEKSKTIKFGHHTLVFLRRGGEIKN